MSKKRKVLFIDRDGTLIKEAPPTYQVDNFSKLEFYPHIFQYMRKIARLDYELVMVTNQDGLGTASFTEDSFWPIHNFIIKAFENEGVKFNKVFIDRSFIADKLSTRKPGTGMLVSYLDDKTYDLKKSFVIGDRITDMQFAKNLGCKGIWIKNNAELGANEISGPEDLKKVISLGTTDWREVYRFLSGK